MIFDKTPLIIQTKPTIWVNPNNHNSLSSFLSWQNLGTITASGSVGATSLTSSSTVVGFLMAGAKFRLGGTDEYTISSISGTTINTVEELTDNYSSAQISVKKVSRITDSSGNNNNIANNSGATQPIYVDNGINDLPVISYDATDDKLIASNPPEIMASGGTVAVVFRKRNITGADFLRVIDRMPWYIRTTTTSRLDFGVVTSGTGGVWGWNISEETDYIAIFTYNSSSVSTRPVIYLNSTSGNSMNIQTAPSGSANTEDGNNLYVGNHPTLARPFNGAIGDVICWDRVLNQAEISMIMTDLAKKYKITLS